jgi:hypothetical protein
LDAIQPSVHCRALNRRRNDESLIRRTNKAARASNPRKLSADCAVSADTDQFVEQEMVAFDRDNIGQCGR